MKSLRALLTLYAISLSDQRPPLPSAPTRQDITTADSALFAVVVRELQTKPFGRVLVNPPPLDTALDVVSADRVNHAMVSTALLRNRFAILKAAGIELTDEVETRGCPSALLPFSELNLSRCPETPETLVALSLPRGGGPIPHANPVTRGSQSGTVTMRAVMARRTKHGSAIEVYDFTAERENGGALKVVMTTPIAARH